MNSIKVGNLVAEKFLLLIFSLFLIFAPYEHKYIGKACFWSGSAIWLLINILKYKQSFYQGIIPASPLNKPILIFGIACLFSILTSLNPYHSQGIFFERYLIYVIIFWIAVGLTTGSKKNLYILISALVFSSFIFVLGGAWDYFYYGCLERNPALAERIWSVFGKRIPYYGFPLYLTYFIPFAFFIFIFIKNKWFKYICLINLILLFLCLIGNASRAAWVSVILSLLFISFLKKRRETISIILTILMLLISLVLFSFSSPTIKNRIKTTLLPTEWSFRLPLYKSAVSIFRDYPIFGVGIGMFPEVLRSPKYELPPDYPVARELNLHAHNTYLEIAAEMGIIGLLTFIGIFMVFFRKALILINKLDREDLENERAILLGLVGTVLAILIFAFSTTIITVGVNNSLYFWLLLGITVGLMQINLPNSQTHSNIP